MDSYIPYLAENYKQPFTDITPLLQTRRPQKVTAECNRELSTIFSSQLSGAVRGFHATMKEYWGSFRPAPSVREIVGTQVRQWNQAGATDVLGIHVRRNDALQSRLRARYASPSDDQIVKWIHEHVGRNSTASAEDNNETQPHYHVFVATDDPGVAKTIDTQFGDEPCVHMFPWKRYPQKHGESIHGQAKAVADLYTLRFCNRVVGSGFSVFTKMAQDTPCFERVDIDAFVGQLDDTAHGLSPQAWDTEPEPRHLVEERERKEKAKLALARKMATEIVDTLVDTVVRRLEPPKPETTPAPPPETPAVVAPLFQRGDHVALVGDTHPEWRGRRGICIDNDDQRRMNVVVDADNGIMVHVPETELVAVATLKPVGALASA